jgi:hypothetical protein
MQLNKVEIEETENQNKSWKTHQIAFLILAVFLRLASE